MLGPAGRVLDEDIARLDVPVHEPDGVRGVQPRGHLGDDVGRPLRWERAAVGAHQPREVPARDEPGGDVEDAVRLAGRVDGQDVRFVDGGDSAGFTQEPDAEVLVSGERRGQYLDRGEPPEHLVARAVNHRHPARANLLF